MKNHSKDVDRVVSTIGHECSRYQFTYKHESKKGHWLQWFLKQVMIKTLFFIHNQIKGKYDTNAYVFQDPRLYFIQQFTRTYFKENMEQRKQDILNAGIDICLFMLKEDIFYRARIIDMFEQFIKLYCNGQIRWNPNMKQIGATGELLFGLDEVEKENLKLWKGK